MNAFPLLIAFLFSNLAFGHGWHSAPHSHGAAGAPPVTTKDIGGAIAVLRHYPLKYAACEKVYDADENFCFVALAAPSPLHLDYAFPIEPVIVFAGNEVTFTADERGYTIRYFGGALSKPEQLGFIKQGLAILEAKGVTQISIQAYRPGKRKFDSSLFQETILGPVVGVMRKIAIRVSDCAKKMKNKTCWVNVVPESAPDHPGPSGGGESVVKEYAFSSYEKVRVELQNLYSDYSISYVGPETKKEKILEKMHAAVDLLKGSEKELYLECPMFTLKKTKVTENLDALFIDTVVSGAVFFEVDMPLTVKPCEATLNLAFQSCEAVFSTPVASSAHDHTGGDEHKEVKVDGDGSLSIYATYVSGNPFWRLNYALVPGVALTPLELVKKGFDGLAAVGQDFIRAYGFRAPKPD